MDQNLKFVTITLTQEEYEAISKLAETLECSLTEYFRTSAYNFNVIMQFAIEALTK